jgi:tRNA (guanine-N7-)-methyltransferase
VSSGEKAARTALYRAEIDERRRVLADELAAVFRGGATPFIWELGAGHGHFLTAYAQAHPEDLCLGIDIIGERVQRATRKRDRARLSNLAFLHAEARLFLETLPAGAKIKRAFVLFPDPWPKVRHRKNRIIQASFLTQLAASATEDCRLYFRTDHTAYFEAARGIVAQHPDWEIIDAQWPFEFVTVFQSRAAGHHSLIARRHSP